MPRLADVTLSWIRFLQIEGGIPNKEGFPTMSRSLKRICAYLLICGAAATISPAQTFTTLVNFDGPTTRTQTRLLFKLLTGIFTERPLAHPTPTAPFSK
jgi:hypothetical protein